MTRSGKSKARARKPETMAGTRTGVSRRLPHQLTMQQAARNTDGRNLWLPGSQLRHKTVHFVKGDNLQPEKTEDQTTSEFEKEPIKPAPAVQLENDTQEAVNIDGNTNGNEEALDRCGFFIDLSSQSVQNTGLTNPVSRPHPSSPEDSSGDEVVFHGRNNNPDPKVYLQYQPRIEDSFSYEMHHVKNEKGGVGSNELTSPTPPILHTNKSSTSEAAMTGQGQSSVAHEKAEYRDDAISLSHRQNSAKKGKMGGLLEEEDAILADYIANIDVDCEETDIPCEVDDREIVTFDGKTECPSFAACMSADEPSVSDEKHGTEGIVQEDVSNSPCLDENSYSEISSDDDDFKERGFGDSELQSDGNIFEDQTLETVSHRFKKGIDPQKTKFPSASRFADALESDPYYGFDIMDFSRPSHRKKAKGKKGPPDFMLSDSELEMELEQAWKNDRDKKKSRKQKREELRSRGLLGRSIDKSDLKSKYADGIGVDDLKLEIRIFLLSSKDSLPLPPMNKQLRKLVHDIANALSMKSHSRGKGLNRFPVLAKTSRTPGYSEQNISQADKILSHGRFRHRTLKEWGHNGKSAKSRSRPNASASYMDGDIVGASAPEIGAENKGRAMLEKMGWSSGTALGATNNKGILLPVAHVVKKSKAGLG